MAKCVECGRRLSFWERSEFDACLECADQTSNQRAERNEAIENHRTFADEAAVIPTTPSNETLAAASFTSIAFVIVALSLICSAIAALALAADGKSFLAIIVFVSGCFSAVLLGLLAEISANIARLVNKSC